jgi:hypothetical protein
MDGLPRHLLYCRVSDQGHPQQPPGFHNPVYCDEHMIGHSGRFETLVSNISLQRAMVMVLGTTACNEDKFTRWSRRCKVLGIIFDLETVTVTMPAPKIIKVGGVCWLS